MGATVFSMIGAVEAQQNIPTDALFSTLYSELHRLARWELARRDSPASLSVTTLLHEAYLDMAGRENAVFPDRARFMGYAARVMRGLIIDNARSRTAIKRGGEFEITSLGTDDVGSPIDEKELSSISDARINWRELTPNSPS